MPTITVTPNTNIVLVNTASGDQTTVNLPPVTPGQLITIRDNVGAASSSNEINITTTGGSVFSTGTILPDGNSNIKISQPFGAVTVGYSGGYKWNILNTFAFENPTFASVDAVTVQSVTFRDLGGSGDNYLLNVTNDILYKDGIKIIEAPEFNSGIARHDGGISSLSSIVSYGLSTVARHPHYGLSSLSSIVSYGLSTVAAQPHYGLSSLSSIVSYGLSSLVGAGGNSTPSNWSAYAAISNLDMAQSNIINVGDISITGQLNLPKSTTIVFGDPNESLSIGNNDVDDQSYLKLTGPTYIDGTLTLTETNITGPNGTSLTYNGNPIGGGGGGDITQWSSQPATTTLDMANEIIDNVGILSIGTTANNISLQTFIADDEVPYLNVDGNLSINGTLTLSTANIQGPVGTLTYNSAPIGGGGGDASTWSGNPATQNVDMDNNDILNLTDLTMIGELRLNSVQVLNDNGDPVLDENGEPIYTQPNIYLSNQPISALFGTGWATHEATSNVNMNNYTISNLSNLTMFGNIQINDYTIYDDDGNPMNQPGNIFINSTSISDIITNIQSTGPTTLSNTLNVEGNTTLSNTLITGITTLTNTLNVQAQTNLSNTKINGTLILNDKTFTTLVNPVGAYIEMTNATPKDIVTYPLYITYGNSINITPANSGGTTGWWVSSTFTAFLGIILLPNYRITYDYGADGNNTSNQSNITNIPSRISLTGSYNTSLYYTLSYINPT